MENWFEQSRQTKEPKPKKERKKLTKKQIVICVLIVILILLLIPIPFSFKDGGSRAWIAVLYRVDKWHQISDDPETGEFGYTVGTTVEILGLKVFDNTRFEPDDRD
ncbi:MAG: hypothetical protein J5772_03380 [Clostridia bacterium]|nr:hypothetical protein [Clostridia bacterium]